MPRVSCRLFRDASELGSGSAQAPPAGVAGPVQPVEVRRSVRVSFDLPSSPSSVARDAEEEDEEDRDSVISTTPVADQTLIRLVSFIYDKYPESCPLSSPPLAPRCGFESLYAVSDPQEFSRPRFCLYLRVWELLDKTRELAATLAKGSKPLLAVLPKKRRLHNVADAPGFATPLTLNPDFSRLVENKSTSKKHEFHNFFRAGEVGGLFQSPVGIQLIRPRANVGIVTPTQERWFRSIQPHVIRLRHLVDFVLLS